MRGLQDELSDLKRRQDRWQDLYLDEQMPKQELRAKSLELAERKARCDARIAEIEAERSSAVNAENKLAEVREILADFPSMWDAMTTDERRHLLDMVIEDLAVDQYDGMVHVRLKLALMPEASFHLPVVSSWGSRGGDARRPKITLRQLALLKELAEGKSLADIQVKWRVGRNSLLTTRRQALRNLGAETVQEAIAKAGSMLDEWTPYLRSSGRYGATPDGPCVPRKLTEAEVGMLQLMAAGWSEKEIADHLGQPMTTIAGTRARIRDKMLARSSEQAVARAVQAGIIGPEAPSPALLLRVYQEIVDGRHDLLVRKGSIKRPSQLQMELLGDYAEGIPLHQTAERRRTTQTAITMARRRVWAVVGGESLRDALERMFELGMVPVRYGVEDGKTKRQEG